ncbi:MAG: methyltransferase domain-containing protein [Candidatus Aminicenantes bacterium]
MDKQKRERKVLGRDVYGSGQYIQYFYPDERRNPFFKIYKRKREDTLRIINRYPDLRFILDVGGGKGRLSLALAKSAGRTVVLTDISRDMLVLAEKNAGSSGNLKLVNADAHRLPFPAGSFDLVVGLDLFCHLEEARKALAEFYRVLREKGILILDSTNSNPLWALFYPGYLGKNPLNWIRILMYGGVYPGWEKIIHHYPKKIFFSLLHEGGFRVVENINYGPPICPKWHLAVCRKNT